jgi:streptomycin 6-kinase
MTLRIPPRVAENAATSSPESAAWLNRLPATVAGLAARWGLELGEPFDGGEVSCAWVAPARRADGSDAVLKVGMPHMEAIHEVQGLRFWDGDPTVRVLDADEEANALLLERCLPGTVLRMLPEPEQDTVLAGLLRRLWRVPPPGHPFRPLAEMADYWASVTEQHEDEWPDPGLVREGLALWRELPRSAADEALLATDLHAGNVLAAEREPWLVIDPKPLAAEREFAVAPLVRSDELGHSRGAALGRLDRLCTELGLDRERARAWTIIQTTAWSGEAAHPEHGEVIEWLR